MTPDLYQRSCDLFLEVCELRVVEQSAFLERACQGDADLLHQVQRMLLEDRRTDNPEPDAAIRSLLETDDSILATVSDSPTRFDTLHDGPPKSFPTITGFTITEQLGEGGMGIVYRALQHSTHREVALKTLPYGRFITVKNLERFEREVKLAASLNHPGIAQIYDSGECDGVPWLAMQLVDGVDLAAYLRDRQLDDRSKLALMATVCGSVAYAHRCGIIHRDLKPGNILVTADGRPYVVDFGLARILDGDYAARRSLSVVGDMLGTPGYMSPEQARGEVEAVDGRTDCYSLGVILYELLTDQPAHDVSGSLIAMIRRIADTELPSPRQVRPTLDRDLESIVMKAVSPRPEDRYQSVEELGRDLHRFLSGQAVIARRHSRSYVLRKWLARRRRSVTVLITIGCIAIAGIGYHFNVLHTERDRAKAETAERIAAIDAKNFGQDSADQVIANPGGQNDSVQNLTPGVSSLESLSATRNLFSSLFGARKNEAVETETRTSPIRYYSGNRIGDGIAGVRHNNPSYTTGISGTAYRFDGKPHSAVNIPADDTLNELNSGTIDAWINSTVYTDPVFETQVILFKEWAFSLSIKHGRIITFDWASDTEFSTDVFVADGKWHHIAMSFRSGVQGGTVLYVDGVEVATTTITFNRSRPRGLAIGSWDSDEGSFCNFVGAIDEVHIWNRVLTPAEIADLVPRNAAGEVTLSDNRIDDGSFESMSVAAVSVLDRPTWTSWKFKGSSGVAYNNSPFGNGKSPDRFQVAYIQQRSEILSTFEVSRAGHYQLMLSSKGREYGGVNPIEVHVDGMAIATVTPSSNVDYILTSIDLPNLTAGSHDISFKGINDSDATSFIDAVSIGSLTK